MIMHSLLFVSALAGSTLAFSGHHSFSNSTVPSHHSSTYTLLPTGGGGGKPTHTGGNGTGNPQPTTTVAPGGDLQALLDSHPHPERHHLLQHLVDDLYLRDNHLLHHPHTTSYHGPGSSSPDHNRQPARSRKQLPSSIHSHRNRHRRQRWRWQRRQRREYRDAHPGTSTRWRQRKWSWYWYWPRTLQALRDHHLHQHLRAHDYYRDSPNL
jgi:hypothetical protein